MIKCFELDIIFTKRSLRTYLLLFCIAVIISVTIKSSFGIAYIFMLALVAASAPFSCESNTNVKKFTDALPVKKADHVKGRYLFLYSLVIAAWVISAVIVFIRYRYGNFEYANVLSCFLAGATVSLIALIQYPLYYKFGLIKGRLLNMAIYMLPIIIAITLPQIARDSVLTVIQLRDFGLIIAIFLAILAFGLFVSYTISKTVVKNKEI